MLFYKLIVDGLDADHLTVHALRGREALSEAYSFRLRVSAKSDRGDVEHLALGQRATLVWEVGRMEAVNPAPRVLHGVVAAVRVLPKGDEGQIQCRIHFVPRLWLLKRKRRTRIFQNMRVSDVVAKVLMEQGIAVRWQLVRDYPLRPYCTQYEESDFEFVTRILAEAGIYFYFLQGGAVDEVSMVASTAAGTLGAAAADVVAASFSSPLIPGDTIVCADDAAFYPPVGGAAFVAARLATTTLAFASEVAAGSVSVASSGSTSVTVGATVAAGGATEAASVQAAPTLQYLTMLEGAVSRSDKVTHLELQTSVRSTAAVFRDYDPERPLTTLESAARSVAPFPESTLKTLASVAAQAGSFVGAAAPPGQLSSALAGAAGDAATALDHAFGEKAAPYLEVYDHHAPFLFPSWAVASEDASRTMRQERRRAVLARGRSGCSDLAAGHKFVLSGHPTSRFDQAYVVASVEHRAWASQHGTRARSRPRNVYENAFECVPATMTYTPPRPPRKSVQVALTAVVVGPPGEDIHVDSMGRIRVQFHWDREGKHDQDSSCWMRTMQAWGGAGWGAQFIPRVGMEVVVTFEGGDPDKPLVLGSIYNATHPSPFRLPEDKTRSGWRTESSPKGGGNNELSFQDRAGKEQIYVHAQKDLDEVIGHNHSLRVRNDERIEIGGNRNDKIEKDLEEFVIGDHTSRVDGNRVAIVSSNEDRRIAGTLTTRVERRERRDVQGPADLVYANDLTVRVLGCSTTIVGKSDKKRSWTTHAEGAAALSSVDRLELSSNTEIVLSVGDSSLRITKGGIELSSSLITTKSEGGACKISKDGLSMKSDGVTMTMGDNLVMKSATSSILVGNAVQLDGPKILLNSPAMAQDAPPKAPAPPRRSSSRIRRAGRSGSSASW